MDKEPSNIDALFLKNGFRKASEILVAHKDELNALNVFPVPDGDTGHNMSACVLEACKELDKIEFDSIKTVSNAIRNGTLMGARGNSGVILSQIFGGFFEVVIKHEKLDIPLFVDALKRANEVATGAVMKPVKGTILTLIKDLSLYSEKHKEDFKDYKHLLEMLSRRAFKVVEKTREMMPKLKQAGVVDAGAKGLAYIVEGFYKYAKGDTEINIEKEGKPGDVKTETQIAAEEMTYMYCTEFMAKLYPGVESKDIDALKNSLDKMGDSMVIVHNSDILKGHIHTDHPGTVFERALKFGELVKVKVDNMKEQHKEVMLSNKEVEKEEIEEKEPLTDEIEADEEQKSSGSMIEPTDTKKEFAFVAVSPGEGISKILKEMNVDYIVFGGQTMNPSTADIANAIDKIDAESIFILPNNSNIILASESAAKMKKSGEKHVEVIPTKSIQEGIAALIAFIESARFEENVENMKMACEEVVSISVTKAVRDSEIGDQKIAEGEYLFFAGKKLILHSNSLEETIINGLENLVLEEYEILTIFYGRDVDKAFVERIKEKLEQEHEELEVSVYKGDQAHYPFYMSLE